jgi:hypothetical protein
MAKGQLRSSKEPRKPKKSEKQALPKYMRGSESPQSKLSALHPERKK